MAAEEPLTIRSPKATRPWQHVLDCLSGYLVIGQKLVDGDASCAEPWNFGPEQQGNRTVEEVLQALAHDWPQLDWHVTASEQPHEAGLLQLDSAKAKARLGWRPVWGYEKAIRQTGIWYRTWLESGEVASLDQLSGYTADAVASGLDWAKA